MRQNGGNDARGGDLRVRRTRKLLEDAFIGMLGNRSFDSITVGDIAKTAMVNRATFYRHYRDKYQLVESLFKEAIDSMIRAVGSPGKPVEMGSDSTDFEKTWVTLFQHVAENDRLYRTLLSGSGDTAFSRRVRDHIVSVAKERTEARIKSNKAMGGISKKVKKPDSDIPYIFLANLLIGNISWWLDDGRRYGHDQVIERTRTFLRVGFRGIIGV